VSSQPVHAKLNSAAAMPATNVSPLDGMLAELRVRHWRPGSTLAANIGSALEALWANRLRSSLTVLGILIGVTSVIAALTLTQGADAYINYRINSIGTIVSVFSGSGTKGGVSQGAGSLSSLTLYDAQSLAHLSHVINVNPVIFSNEQATYGSQSLLTQVEGVETNFQTTQNIQLAQGAWFSSLDTSSGSRVAVLGYAAAAQLFGSNNPLGQQIRIRDQEFRVVGVISQQGRGLDSDTAIYIPLKTAQVRLKNTPHVDQILVQADTVNNVALMAQDVTVLLRQNHHLSKNHADDFDVTTFIQFLNQANSGNQILLYLLVGIAAISLTVGGIGIMNIMLVSVTERTWEIGIRMSIGGRQRDIRNQFFIEALMLCLLGGVIGLLLGISIGWALVNGFGLPFVVTPLTLVVPFAVSAAIALVFGLYPAIRASRLDPILAIRIDE
jgi:putative ABC transport system permease protein